MTDQDGQAKIGHVGVIEVYVPMTSERCLEGFPDISGDAIQRSTTSALRKNGSVTMPDGGKIV